MFWTLDKNPYASKVPQQPIDEKVDTGGIWNLPHNPVLHTQVHTVEKTVRLAGQLRALLAKGGFHLTKSASSSRDVSIASTPESDRRVISSLNLYPWNVR